MLSQPPNQKAIPPWDDGDIPTALMAVLPLPGIVLSERHYPLLDAHEMKLPNGMRVCWKHTTFMEDEVLLSGYAWAGLSEVSHWALEAGSRVGHSRVRQSRTRQNTLQPVYPSIICDELFSFCGGDAHTPCSWSAYEGLLSGYSWAGLSEVSPKVWEGESRVGHSRVV